jgi:hypothetical protein
LALIPLYHDETASTIYALAIKPGEFMPLVNVDPITAIAQNSLDAVIPTQIVSVKAGSGNPERHYWRPACAGMTNGWQPHSREGGGIQSDFGGSAFSQS